MRCHRDPPGGDRGGHRAGDGEQATASEQIAQAVTDMRVEPGRS
jgi:hypothetical protein